MKFRNPFITIVFMLFFFNNGQADNVISYLYKDISYQKTSKTENGWIPFNGFINNGLNNGVYWLKLELIPSKSERVIRIPESHVTNTTLLFNNSTIPVWVPNDYITYKIPASNKHNTYYLKVNCLLEARITLDVLNISQYYQNKTKAYITKALYYGIVLIILLFNLFSYINLKNKAYLYYMFMVFGMALNAFYKDGLIAFLFGFNGVNEVLELYINLILPISAIFFAKSYLDQKNKLFRIRRIGTAVAFLCIFGTILFHSTHNFTIYVWTNIFQLLTLNIFWLYGIILWKKNVYARFYAIAYGLPLLIAHDYYFSPYFGFSLFNTSPNFYKIGSIFEMLVFTYAIMHFTKNLALKNKVYRLKIVEYAKLIEKNSATNTTYDLEKELIKTYKFTPTEIKILKSLADKNSNKIIAEKHFISENTVKFHVKNIYTKFEVNNRKQAQIKYHNFTTSISL